MRWQTIDHALAHELEVNISEYLLLNMIYAFSTNPEAPVRGWCSASASKMASFLRISERTIERYINRLCKPLSDDTPPLIEKGDNGSLKRTTKYYNELLKRYQNESKSKWRSHRQNGGKAPTKSRRNLRQSGGETSDKLADYVYKDVSNDVKEDDKVIVERAKYLVEIWCLEIMLDPVIAAHKLGKIVLSKYWISLWDQKKWGDPMMMTKTDISTGFKSWVLRYIELSQQQKPQSPTKSDQDYDGSYED